MMLSAINLHNKNKRTKNIKTQNFNAVQELNNMYAIYFYIINHIYTLRILEMLNLILKLNSSWTITKP